MLCALSQVKYKEEGRKDISKNLYSLLPETPETHFARHMSEIQSEVGTLNASQSKALLVAIKLEEKQVKD